MTSMKPRRFIFFPSF